MRKAVGRILLVFGVALILVGVVVRFIILPAQAQWPDDVDSTRTYEGTLHAMLNPQALANRDLGNIFVRDVPITISRHVTTEDAQGDRAIVHEVATLYGPGGREIQASETWYAIDRKTMEAIPKADVTNLVGGDQVLDREGLVIGFPIGTGKKNYAGWSSDYQTTVDARFVREEERGGLNTYVFESSSSPEETKDPEMLALFPQAVPRDLLQNLGSMLDLPELIRTRFAEILPDLPDLVPLKYTYEYETTYWIEPATGVLIDYAKHEAYKVALQLRVLPQLVPIIPVFEQSYHTSTASVQDAAEDAKSAKAQLDLYGKFVPAGLLLGGLVLAVAGVFVMRR